MMIIGIDPGTHTTGYGLIHISHQQIKFVEAGIIKSKQKDPIQNRLLSIYQGLSSILDQHTPDVLVLEELYTHYKFPATVPILGHVRGVICLLTVIKKMALEEYSVKRIRKSVTGNGNATKEQTQRMVCHFLKIKEAGFSLDTSDALALALGHAFMKTKANL